MNNAITLEEARKMLSEWIDYTRGWQTMSIRRDSEKIMVSKPEPIPMEIFAAIGILLNATRETK